MDYLQHDVPRRNFNGQTSIYCRTCKREIARTADCRIRSVSKCAVCMLTEQGVKDAEKYVLPQYVMTDPTKPPIPLYAQMEDAEFEMFPEERDNRVKSSGGVVGTVKAIYRALGFGREPEPTPPKSKITVRQRKTGLYD